MSNFIKLSSSFSYVKSSWLCICWSSYSTKIIFDISSAHTVLTSVFLCNLISQRLTPGWKKRRKKERGRKHCWDCSQCTESSLWLFWASLGFVISSSLIQRLSPLISSNVHSHSSHTWDNENFICKQFNFLSSAKLFFFLNGLKRKGLHWWEKKPHF